MLQKEDVAKWISDIRYGYCWNNSVEYLIKFSEFVTSFFWGRSNLIKLFFCFKIKLPQKQSDIA